MKETWEKIFEYASMPVHGTLSRKLRKGEALQINEGKKYENTVLFLGEGFVRIAVPFISFPNITEILDIASLRIILKCRTGGWAPVQRK